MALKLIGGGRMKIGVDAGCLGIKDKRLKVGVYQATFNLLRELGKIGRQNEYLLYSFNPISLEVLSQLSRQVRNVVVRPTFGWNCFALPLRLLKDKPDFFFGPSQALPRFCPCPALIIVHDLAFEHYPQFYPNSCRQLRRITLEAIRKAKKIIAVSEFTKKDLMKIYDVPEERITVVYEGIDSIFKPQSIARTTQPYFLFVGALKKSKNIPRILQAYAEFLKKSLQKISFVFAGGDFWLDEEIKPTVEKLGLKDKVKFLGFVPQKDLPVLYSGALAFVSPSLYEGFGLTLSEAMACGCPVIAGNSGAQPEVVGKAGILVDPKDISAISAALSHLASSSSLRQKLTRAGLSHAKNFSWEKFAKEVLEIIKVQCHISHNLTSLLKLILP